MDQGQPFPGVAETRRDLRQLVGRKIAAEPLHHVSGLLFDPPSQGRALAPGSEDGFVSRLVRIKATGRTGMQARKRKRIGSERALGLGRIAFEQRVDERAETWTKIFENQNAVSDRAGQQP